MRLYKELQLAVNESDVNSNWKNQFKKYCKGCEITSPNNTDGIIKYNDIEILSEFKYDINLKESYEQAIVLIQVLFYLEKRSREGIPFPDIIFCADKNECFLSTPSILEKYFKSDVDWDIAPSSAAATYPSLVEEISKDLEIYTYSIEENFDFKNILEEINKLKENERIIQTKVITENIQVIYKEFEKYVLKKPRKSKNDSLFNSNNKKELSVNDKANLFVSILLNSVDNYVHPHPKKRNILVTKSYGEVKIDRNKFNAFFSKYSRSDYNPEEKDKIIACIDTLIEDETRRSKGEFFTPDKWVDEAHKLIAQHFGEDWKEKYVVWDCAWGNGNLTRKYKFKELYCSTLEQCDIDTAKEQEYNPEATKFQFDFLNDHYDELPESLQNTLEGKDGKEVIFLINPPYGRSNNSKYNNIKQGNNDTLVSKEMKNDKFGGAANLYTQFLYRIWKINNRKNISICCFTKMMYKTASSFKIFRNNFFKKFKFEDGFIFNSSNFTDTAGIWPVDFSIWKSGKQISNVFPMYVENNIKNVYNLDNKKSLNKLIINTEKPEEYPKFSSGLSISESKWGSGIPKNSFGTLVASSNNIQNNTNNCYLLSGGETLGHGKYFINKENFINCCTIFTARKSIRPTWINDCDEYMIPNEQHPSFNQFQIDSLVYSLFNNASYQSSLRNITYNNKQWDIPNQFFWLPKKTILTLAKKHNYDKMYKDCLTSNNRHVTDLLYKDKLIKQLSPDAKELIKISNRLVIDSIEYRKEMDNEFPEYHLSSWDAGYAQLKLVWKKYMKEEFIEFRKKYELFNNRMSELVYELGFLYK